MKTLVLATALSLAAGAAFAGPGMHADRHPGMRPGGHHGMMMGGPGLNHGLYPPEFVLENRSTLALTDEQVNAITNEISAAHDATMSVQTGIRPLAEKLHGMLQAPQIDEAGALSVASQIMDLEHQIKTAHLRMMIRVKNLLTADQLAKLKQMRPPRPMRPPDAPPDAPPPAPSN